MTTGTDFATINGKHFRIGQTIRVTLHRGKKDTEQLVSHEDTGRVILLNAESLQGLKFPLDIGTTILGRIITIKETFIIIEPLEAVSYPEADSIVKQSAK